MLSGLPGAEKPKLPFAQLPFEALEECAAAQLDGNKKYRPLSWRAGMSWRENMDAALRHISKFMQGEEVAEDSGVHHCAHAALRLLYQVTWSKTQKGKDDRR